MTLQCSTQPRLALTATYESCFHSYINRSAVCICLHLRKHSLEMHYYAHALEKWWMFISKHDLHLSDCPSVCCVFAHSSKTKNLHLYTATDSNPGPVFSIPGFGIGEFLILGSRYPGRIMESWQYDIKNRYYWVHELILLNLRFLSPHHRPMRLGWCCKVT